MLVNESQVFNLMDTDGRREDVVNVMQVYLQILMLIISIVLIVILIIILKTSL